MTRSLLVVAVLGMLFGCASAPEESPQQIVDDVALDEVGPFRLGANPETVSLAAAARGDALGCHIQGNHFICQPEQPSDRQVPYTLLFQNGELVLIGWDVRANYGDLRERYEELGQQVAEEQTNAPEISGVWVNADSTVKRNVSCPLSDSLRGTCVVTASLTDPSEIARLTAGSAAAVNID